MTLRTRRTLMALAVATLLTASGVWLYFGGGQVETISPGIGAPPYDEP